MSIFSISTLRSGPEFLTVFSRLALLLFLLLTPALSGAIDPREPVVITGEWGTIEYYEVALEPPTSALWDSLFDERSYWNFGPLSKEQSLELLYELGFSPELVEKVATGGIWTQSELGIEVETDDEIVESLTTANRTALSGWARANNPNFLRKQIMNLEIHDDDSLLRKLKPSTVALIRSLTFLRGNVVSIMDRPYLMRQLGDDEQEKQALVQTLFSTKTLVARLVVDDNADIDALAEYWSADGKNPGVRALLEAAKATPKMDRIDLVYLLPPFPKKYIGTFVRLEDAGKLQAPDCFWASIHFFKSRVSPRMLDKLYIEHYLDHDFERVEGTPRFGDIVMLFDAKTDKFIHSYVQIAGPLVFTKNGASFARPLILKTYEDMMAVYEEGYDFKTEIYRRRIGT